MIELGTKVRVAVPALHAPRWAQNYLKAVQGLTGVVVEKGEDHLVGGTVPKSRVDFDSPPKDPSVLAPRGRLLTTFWFQDSSLEER